MARKVIQVALNGVTGRMGYRQHLVRSLLSIREQGGVRLSDGTVVYPEPVLVGRSEERLRAIAAQHGLDRWTTCLDEVLADPSVACKSEQTARRTAERLAQTRVGVIAWSRTGDAELGDFDEDPVILFRAGRLPAGLDD